MYSNLSEDALYCLFTEKKWSSMNEDMRLSALQEVECRMAVKQGRPVCKIHAEAMPARNLGSFDGSGITLNSSLLRNPRSLFGKIRNHGGISALDTVIHEGRHAFQYAVISNKTTVKVSAATRRAWALNTVAYMSGKGVVAFSMYAFQPIERDARGYAAREMSRIYRSILRTDGHSDPLFEKGLEQLRKEKEKEYLYARTFLNEENIKENLAILQFKTRLLYGMNVSVPVFGENIPVQELFADCGITEDAIGDLLEEQVADHRAILRGEKSLDAYMDGLIGGDDAPDTPDAPDDFSDSDPPTETLDELVARLLGSKPVKDGSASSVKVRPDGVKHRF